MVSDWTNFLEIRAYGLMRSGNHAIIEWLQNQHSGHITCFLNNIKHGDYDPFLNYEQKVLSGIDEQIDIEGLRKLRKHLLIYSYEDRQELEISEVNFHESVFQEDFEENHNNYLGSSKHRFDVLIIRDPFNFLASRLKLLRVWGPQSGVNDLAWIVRNWKILAKKAITFIQDPTPSDIVANYNFWVSDLGYRKDLSNRLMGTFSDTTIENVPQFGGGSSFRDTDKLTMSMIMANWKKLFSLRRYARFGHYWRRLTTSENKNKTFERWKNFATDELFLKIFQDQEIFELSKKIFGEIPGTREFAKIP